MDIEILAQRFYEYSVHVRGFSNNTVQRYTNVINFYRTHYGLTTIEQINESNLRALFLNGRMQRNWSSHTYLVYYKSLIVFFKWCVKEGYMQANPLSEFEKPRIEKSLPKKVNKQDALRIMEAACNYPYDNAFLRYRNHAIFAMFIYAGLRKQELLSLAFAEVDIENCSIFVRRGKGNKDRVIPMSFTLSQILKKYVEYRKRLNKTCPEFFTSSTYNKGFTYAGLKKLVHQMNVASGVKFSAHKLRHTFATLMIEGGCDIYSLSRMMGHSDISTTTIYLSASVEHLRSQMVKHPLNFK